MVCLQPSATTSGDQAPFELVGDAPGFKDVVLRLPTIANADGAVLITGETGTGKDLIARAIHGLGPRAARPFVTVRCDTLADSAFEREWIAAAAGGTLFLDEADALSERAQTTLLGMIPNGADRPFGSGDDVRLVAASRSALTVPVRTGRFRADLYYRLSVFSITLPPLRERREDILPLSTHFITKHGAGATAARLAPAAECALMACEWPGNVRELESVIVRAIHFAHDGVIEHGDLGIAADAGSAREALTYKAQKQRLLEAFERHYLQRLMAEHRGNVTRAARASGKERRDLGKRLKRLGIDPRTFAH